MKFRPCIDLHKGKVKQIVGSSLSDTDEDGLDTNFETDESPAFFSQLYKKHRLYGGHVIMLGPGNENAAMEALGAFPNGLQVGGGITPENAPIYLDTGASQVIVTSYVFTKEGIAWERLSELSRKIGKERIVLDLSCRKAGDRYHVATNRWQTITDLTVSAKSMEVLAAYCSEFLIHAADVEGKRQGIDEELVGLLSEYSPISATYAGGIRSLDDMELVNTCGKGRIDATVGSALDIFGGSLPFDDVVKWHKSHNK
jgi:phosphoribosylformimino-5-aminoimidazole carboxamide ribotide isomerase